MSFCLRFQHFQDILLSLPAICLFTSMTQPCLSVYRRGCLPLMCDGFGTVCLWRQGPRPTSTPLGCWRLPWWQPPTLLRTGARCRTLNGHASVLLPGSRWIRKVSWFGHFLCSFVCSFCLVSLFWFVNCYRSTSDTELPIVPKGPYVFTPVKCILFSCQSVLANQNVKIRDLYLE